MSQASGKVKFYFQTDLDTPITCNVLTLDDALDAYILLPVDQPRERVASGQCLTYKTLYAYPENA